MLMQQLTWPGSNWWTLAQAEPLPVAPSLWDSCRSVLCTSPVSQNLKQVPQGMYVYIGAFLFL